MLCLAALLVACPADPPAGGDPGDVPASRDEGSAELPADGGGGEPDTSPRDAGRGDEGGNGAPDPGPPPEPGPPPADPSDPPLPVLGALVVDEVQETWSAEDTAEYVERWAPAFAPLHGVEIHRLLYTTYSAPGLQTQASALAVLLILALVSTSLLSFRHYSILAAKAHADDRRRAGVGHPAPPPSCR